MGYLPLLISRTTMDSPPIRTLLETFSPPAGSSVTLASQVLRSLLRTAGCPLMYTFLEPSARYSSLPFGRGCFLQEILSSSLGSALGSGEATVGLTICLAVFINIFGKSPTTCGNWANIFETTSKKVCGCSGGRGILWSTVPAARAAGLPLIRVLLEPDMILPSSLGGNKLLTQSAALDKSSLPPVISINTPTANDTNNPPGRKLMAA